MKFDTAATYIFVTYHTGYCGMDGVEVIDVAGMSHTEISDMLQGEALQHAETYGVYPYPEDEECDMVDEDDAQYSDNIDFWYEAFDAEKHDCQKPGGGKWFDE